MTLLEITNLSKNFGSFFAVNDVTFSLENGDMLGFLGRNGAGKSTTFRMILGLIEPSSGSILFENKKIAGSNFDEIGFLPEERGLHTNFTVEEELRYMAGLKGLSLKDIKKKVDYWLNKFNINENKSKKISTLSKGNQQKIQLIASLLHEPKLLILDEPFSGLDPLNVEVLKSAIKDINKNGTTIIFSSHRLDHIEELCNKVAILNKGNLLEYGTLSEVKSTSQQKKVLIETTEDISDLNNKSGVTHLNKNKDTTILTIENEQTYKEIFQYIKKLNLVTHFQIMKPSINDIFIELVEDKEESGS